MTYDRPVQAKGVVHELVAETAKAMAHATYQGMAMRHNDFYAKWPCEETFVARRWQSFIQPAREELASLLNPERASLTTESQKQEIHQALLLNAASNPAQNMVDRIIH
jgi:uridine phosphorylase